MAKHPQQRGPLTPRFERRHGHDQFPPPGGVNTESDAASIQPHQFRRLVNVDIRGNDVKPRGGQDKLHDAPIHHADAEIHPWGFDIGTPMKVWWSGAGCAGESSITGVHIANFDTEQEPQLQRVAWYVTTNSPPVPVTTVAVAKFSGEIYVTVNDGLRRFNLTAVPWGTENLVISGSGQDVELCSFPGFKCNAMHAFDGQLFLVLESLANPTTQSKIVAWDGITLRDDLTGLNTPVAIGLWRDQLVVGFAAAANHIRLREAGASPGTWATVAPGAGTIGCIPGRNSIVSYKDKLYVGDPDGTLWSYDGTTLAVANTPAGITILGSICAAFGYLFYGYTAGASGARLGRYDGTTWVDLHKDFTTLTQVSGSTQVPGMALYRSRLVAGIVHPTQQARLALSIGDDTASLTWAIVSNTGDLAGVLQNFVVM